MARRLRCPDPARRGDSCFTPHAEGEATGLSRSAFARAARCKSGRMTSESSRSMRSWTQVTGGVRIVLHDCPPGDDVTGRRLPGSRAGGAGNDERFVVGAFFPLVRH